MKYLAIVLLAMLGLLSVVAEVAPISPSLNTPPAAQLGAPIVVVKEFPAVKIDEFQLQIIVNEIHGQLPLGERGREHYNIADYEPKGGKRTPLFMGVGSAFIKDPNLPRYLYKFAYFFSDPGGEVSSIQLMLDDEHRRLTVEGTDRKQIDSIVASVEKGFVGHTSRFGGAQFRYHAWLISLALCIGVAWTCGWLIRRRQQKELLAIILILSLWLLITILFAPGAALFPGFKAYKVISFAYPD